MDLISALAYRIFMSDETQKDLVEVLGVFYPKIVRM
jgi:hypothetical protein